MCGVFGYVGRESDVGGTVLAALKTLEYRGYDSWGLAVAAPDGLVVDKDIGRINGQRRDYPVSSLGFGHTRWATHGGVTVANAHPHVDCTRRIAVVHNGIIENHAQLRAGLEARGHRLVSETDSEVVSHLVEERIASGEPLGAAVARVFEVLDGYNAVVVMDFDGLRFAATKRVSPLVIGIGERGLTISSDAIALHGHADQLIYLEDDQLAVLGADGVDLLDRGTLSPLTPMTVDPNPLDSAIGHGPFPDYMSKEVAEQPDALRRLIHEGRDEVEGLAAAIRSAADVYVIGCGTAGNAALAASYLFSDICSRELSAIPASEFRYRARHIGPDSLVIALSQSGETVDVLDAMMEARNRGAQLAAILNTPNSTLDRMVRTRVLLRAGAEHCVLATKSYTTKLAALILTAYILSSDWKRGADAVLVAAQSIAHLLHPDSQQRVREIASRVSAADHLFAIGRGVHFPSALEAALKIKEVSYIHAEGFASGELKHGVIALIEPGTPCLVFAPDDETRNDILSGASELRSRGGHIIGIGTTSSAGFDDFISIADAGAASPIAEAVPAQLLGYFAAKERGHDPDRPRNLAKSVTVK
jgi:glucosamine--fructose-6-phosphate aminotransferase (isomerizing)